MSIIDHRPIESSARQHDNNLFPIARMDNEHGIHCLEVVRALGLSPKRDGDQWYYLLGENLQEGVAGFGKSIMSAAMNFYENLSDKKTCHEEDIVDKSTVSHMINRSYKLSERQ